MPRIFSKSITKGVKFVENPEVVSCVRCTSPPPSLSLELIDPSYVKQQPCTEPQKPPSVQFVLSQEYTGIAPPVTKLINSLVTLHVNPSTNLIET